MGWVPSEAVPFQNINEPLCGGHHSDHDRVDSWFPMSQNRDLGNPNAWARLRNHRVTVLAGLNSRRFPFLHEHPFGLDARVKLRHQRGHLHNVDLEGQPRFVQRLIQHGSLPEGEAVAFDQQIQIGKAPDAPSRCPRAEGPNPAPRQVSRQDGTQFLPLVGLDQDGRFRRSGRFSRHGRAPSFPALDRDNRLPQQTWGSAQPLAEPCLRCKRGW